MNIKGATALVTGGNRGLGKAFVDALLAAGAAKVYAASRAGQNGPAGSQPVKLDITDQSEVARAAATCGDVDLLINNAGIAVFSPLLEAPDMDTARAMMETNYFGTLSMCRAFAPVLKTNGGGALVNMLSVVSFINVPMQGAYSASKAAAWSMTNGIRIELRAQGTLVVGVHAGYIDTDMTAHLNVAKSRPEDIAARTLEGIEEGREEVLADQRARDVKAVLAGEPSVVYAGVQKAWDERVRR